MTKNQTNGFALSVLISVFFFWGFVASANAILIPLFKESFNLSQFQSQMVETAFYAAYFIGSLIYFVLSQAIGDPINKIGYKKGLIIGLSISAIGTLGFIPAADLESFPLMLSSLFIVGLGFSLQQIVANPYVIALGSPETGSHRVSLAGGINSLGTTIAPLIISFALFGSVAGNVGNTDLNNVKMPYLLVGAAFLAVAIIIALTKLPKVQEAEKVERGMGALKFPQVWWGMLAIFVYVGVEVTIQGNLPELMKGNEFIGKEADETAHFISLYWGSLMIGRWVGALTVFNLKKLTRQLLTFIVPFVAFAVIIGANYIKGSPINDLVNYWPVVLIGAFSFLLAQEKPARTMILFGILAAIAMLIGLLTEGTFAVYAFITGGIFCSIMWPCIFSLSLAGLGKYTSQASSLLIMMILGGALIPPLQGAIGDSAGMHISYIVPLVGFLVLAFYGVRIKQILKSQGIDYDESVGSGD